MENQNDRIKIARKQRELSQEELGRRINRSKSFVCKVELGQTQLSPAQLSILASALGVNELWLRTGAGDMTDHELTRDRRSIGERMLEVRKESQLTQRQIAQILHVSRNTISLLERNKISASSTVVAAVVEKMGTDEHWLRTGEKESRAEEIKKWLEAHPADLEEIERWINGRLQFTEWADIKNDMPRP